MPPCTAALLALALAADGAPLAPTLGEFTRHRTELRRAVAEGQALVEAVARLHNAWVDDTRPGTRAAVCTQPALVSLGARASALLSVAPTTRSDLERRLARLDAFANAPTVAPLLHPNAAEQLRQRGDEVHRVLARLDEARSWHDAHVGPRIRSCEIVPEASPGVARDPWTTGPVAIVAIGGGTVCPAGVPAEDRVVFVEGPACVAPDATCACTPEAVAPGAVLATP